MTLEKQKRLLPDKRHLCYLLKPRTYLVALGFLAPMVGNAQTEKVNVSVKNNTFSEFFKQIESQTNYTFVYRNSVLNPATKVNVSSNGQALIQVLQQVLEPLGLTHSVNGKVISIVKKQDKQAPASKSLTKDDKKGVMQPITGSVVDEKGEPIIGATVYVKNRNVGTVTNIDGAFNIEVAPEDILLVSYIGYQPQEISSKGKQKLHVVLREDNAQKLDEIVVVGYGKQKKESVTAAISTMSTKELVQTPQANVSNMLVGRMPGLVAVQRSGAPGEDASSLLVRGVSTFTDNTEPLVMIDGVERPNFNGIDPNEIESVNILKDASATAIYGVRGANGVVLITTRKGSKSKPSLSYSANVSLQQPTALPHYLNSADYATLYNEAQKNDAYASGATFKPRFTDKDIELYKNGFDPVLHPNMDWTSDFLKKTSFRTQHNFNISGGTERVKYFISAGYFDQQGMFKHTKIDKDHDVNSRNTRYNFRSNLDFTITDDFTASAQLAVQIEDVVTPGTGNSDIWRAVSFANPLSSPGMIDGKIVKIQDGLGATNPWQSLLSNGFSKDSRNNLNSTFKLTYDLSRILLKGLKVHASIAYDSYYYSRKKFYKSYPFYVARRDQQDPNNVLLIPQIEETVWDTGHSWNKNKKVYFEAALNYDQQFGKHHVTGLLLYNQSKYYSPALKFNVPNAYQGLVSRITYAYDSRYLAEINMGYNGTENFAKGKRFGFFPAFSMGWVVSEEPFFPKNDWVVFLKLRGSYGEVGNDQIGGERFLYMPSSYGYAPNKDFYKYHFGDASSYSTSRMIIENKIGNPNLTWEKARKMNFGFEANLLKNHLTVSFDVFKEKRNNILANRSTQPMIIGANLPAYNLGEMENKGWELDVNYRNRINKLNYWVRFNYSFARNKILYRDEVNKRYKYQLETGRRKDQFFGLLTDGFYNSWEEINSLSRPRSAWSGNKLQPGDVKYVDVNKDGEIDNYDMVPIGYSPIPEIVYGFSFGFNWNNWDFSALWQGADNVSIKYFGRSLWPFIKGEESAKELIKERWTPERYAANDKITFPRLSLNPNRETDHNYRESDLWIRDAKYLRLKNVEVGYTFKKAFVKSLGLESVRLYVSGSNLLTLTKVIDLDPEAPSKGGNVEINTYPLQRVYNLGINVNF